MLAPSQNTFKELAKLGSVSAKTRSELKAFRKEIETAKKNKTVPILENFVRQTSWAAADKAALECHLYMTSGRLFQAVDAITTAIAIRLVYCTNATNWAHIVKYELLILCYLSVAINCQNGFYQSAMCLVQVFGYHNFDTVAVRKGLQQLCSARQTRRAQQLAALTGVVHF